MTSDGRPEQRGADRAPGASAPAPAPAPAPAGGSDGGTADWRVYRGDRAVDGRRLDALPPPPPWREFSKLAETRARTFQPPPRVVEVVNAALYLRRPLLVTGEPGTGKSSLAYAIAWELELGSVLQWNINSRSTLGDALYQYDVLARLREIGIERARRAGSPGTDAGASTAAEDIGRFITLGPIGTAFMARERPRVVLIDEIDKSDVDLPNDLLHVLENGEFEIPELVRMARSEADDGSDAPSDDSAEVSVATADHGKAGVRNGVVRCRVFPVTVITSNGERDLPPAFLRRCLRVDLPRPDADHLERVVRAHLESDDANRLDDDVVQDMLAKFEAERSRGRVATDQLLNAIFLVSRDRPISEGDRDVVEQAILRRLDES